MNREEAKKELLTLLGYYINTSDITDISDSTTAIDMAIEALKEPIIYCKDCKYYKTPDRYSYTEHNLYCCRSALMKMYENDFCSKGERREDIQHATN